ncbi:MAG: hypothetical protein LBN05_00135 [Oscillospiraceae bacterium]|nr:hypothetical protein [Oscillospiraceae bacterium]
MPAQPLRLNVSTNTNAKKKSPPPKSQHVSVGLALLALMLALAFAITALAMETAPENAPDEVPVSVEVSTGNAETPYQSAQEKLFQLENEQYTLEQRAYADANALCSLLAESAVGAIHLSPADFLTAGLLYDQEEVAWYADFVAEDARTEYNDLADDLAEVVASHNALAPQIAVLSAEVAHLEPGRYRDNDPYPTTGMDSDTGVFGALTFLSISILLLLVLFFAAKNLDRFSSYTMLAFVFICSLAAHGLTKDFPTPDALRDWAFLLPALVALACWLIVWALAVEPTLWALDHYLPHWRESLPTPIARNRATREGYAPPHGAREGYAPHHKLNVKVGPEVDIPSGNMGALCVLLPPVGLALWVLWHQDSPEKSHSALRSALTGVAVWVVLGVAYYFYRR